MVPSKRSSDVSRQYDGRGERTWNSSTSRWSTRRDRMSTSGLIVVRASSPWLSAVGSKTPGDSAPGTVGPSTVPVTTATSPSAAPAASIERWPASRWSDTQWLRPSWCAMRCTSMKAMTLPA